MKSIILFTLLFTMIAFGGDEKQGHSNKKSDLNAKQQSEEMTQKKNGHAMISLPTIQCNNCVKTIESAVKKLDGVESVKIDLEKKMAHVNFDPEKLEQKDIEKAITAAGYDANNVKRDEKAHNDLPSCCQLPRK
jgi:copper ion binding protein